MAVDWAHLQTRIELNLIELLLLRGIGAFYGVF
jgi:hypothetical protein